MGRHAMLSLATRLRRSGFSVENFAYNTVTGSLAAATARLRAVVNKDERPVALVGHSLGGLVSLHAAQGLPVAKVSSVVMLGSPYQGAEAGVRLRKLTGGPRSIVARALADWAKLDSKPTVQVPVYTLVGTRSAGLGRIVCGFTEPNDGTVTVAETNYPGATSRQMAVSHTGMLFDVEVANQVAAWLQPQTTTTTGCELPELDEHVA